MKINTSYLIAGGLLVAIAAWFLIHRDGEAAGPTGSTAADTIAASDTSLPAVQVRTVTAELHDDVLSLFGQTRAAREVDVKSETAGRIVSAPIAEGRTVARGTVVCRLNVNARQAQLDQARANLRAVEADLNAAKTLAEKGFQSTTRVGAFEAQRDAALAAVKSAEIELDNVNIRAPFTGIWERQTAQVGDYLAPGQSCGLLVDLSPLKVSVQLTQDQLRTVQVGAPAMVKLQTGQSVQGEVAFIEAKADPATRTFRTELHVPNADFALKAGVTAMVELATGEALATKIPSNILTLNTAGDVGVRYVDASNTVRFAQVRTVGEDADGAWVTGLPDRARIITTGQDFVAIGQQVAPDETYGARTAARIGE